MRRAKAEIYGRLLEKTNQNLERIKEDSKYEILQLLHTWTTEKHLCWIT